MRHHLLPTSITMAPPSSVSSSSASPSLVKPPKRATITPPNCINCPFPNSLCKHPPSATLDLLILLLVLFSGAFLIASYCSYIINSLCLLLPSFSLSTFMSTLFFQLQAQPVFYSSSLIFSLILLFISVEIRCRSRSRKCGKIGCKGLKSAMEFDLKLLGDESMKLGKSDSIVKEIDELPWKGGSEFNRDYECLREELRKMAPPNGRAVLLFRSKCGCARAKLEGWAPKRTRRQKKSLSLYNADHQ